MSDYDWPKKKNRRLEEHEKTKSVAVIYLYMRSHPVMPA
jgi:hypothetical protein